MTWAEIVIAFATLSGPILAVQIQKYLEAWRETRARRLQVFRVLMATRATKLAPEHVNALNSIPIDFYGKKLIINKWEEYIDILNENYANIDIWSNNREIKFQEMLDLISRDLGYKFKLIDIKRIYFPIGHEKIEFDNNRIREGLVKILTGEKAIDMNVREFPNSPEFSALQVAALENTIASYKDGKLQVSVKKED